MFLRGAPRKRGPRLAKKSIPEEKKGVRVSIDGADNAPPPIERLLCHNLFQAGGGTTTEHNCKSAVENRRFLQRFYSASMGFHRIADWRVGGESTHKSAPFLYGSIVGRINI